MAKLTMDEKYTAVFSTLPDLILTTKEIQQAILAKFPDTNVGSMNIADHVPSARQSQQYAVHCFDKVAGGYKVRKVADWKQKPATGRGSNGQSDSEAIASLKAKIEALTKGQGNKPAVAAPNATASAPVTGTVPVTVASKANGEAKPAQTATK